MDIATTRPTVQRFFMIKFDNKNSNNLKKSILQKKKKNKIVLFLLLGQIVQMYVLFPKSAQELFLLMFLVNFSGSTV